MSIKSSILLGGYLQTWATKNLWKNSWSYKDLLYLKKSTLGTILQNYTPDMNILIVYAVCFCAFLTVAFLQSPCYMEHR